MEPVLPPTSPQNSDKYSKLFLCLLFDAIGYLSFIAPIFGDFIDVIWAPISGLLMLLMFKGAKAKLAAIFSVIEELAIFTDVIPTFTITWIYTYIFCKGEGQE